MRTRDPGSSRSIPSSRRVIPRPRHRFPGRAAERRRGSPAIASPSSTDAAALLHRGGAEEHCSRNAIGLGDHVRAVVHPVGEVHIEMRGRSEHHRADRGRRAAEGVRGGVVRSLDRPRSRRCARQPHRGVPASTTSAAADQVAGHLLPSAARTTRAVARLLADLRVAPSRQAAARSRPARAAPRRR